ncbi:MAG: outer membrane protein assembly factor BamA [candidate division WOR-3 bacterium]|nr:MAG: outer membrane protein assembly factor BamA [candidate division WOR-3 bacterium]
MILLLFLLNYTIVDIETDAQWTDSQLILQASGLQVGSEFHDEDITQVIQNLSKLRLFNYIAVDTSIVGDGIFLTIVVDEAPFLKGFPDFIGNKKLSNKTLRNKIELTSGQVLTDKTVFDAKNKIITLYEEKYFYNTVVRDSLVKDTLNKVKLFFIVTEGVEPRIKKINIVGNETFTDREIKGKMATKEKGFLRTGKLTREKLEEDVEKIKSFYQDMGFLDVHIDEPIIEVEGNRFIITINLQENKKYFFGNTSFQGNTVFDTPLLQRMIKFSSGDVYSLSKAEESIGELYTLYADEGYIYCNISPNENVRDSIIDIAYTIYESSPASINRVIVAGNNSTRENVIRREIVTMPGERFRRSAVIRSLREIFNLGFFEDVQPLTGPPDDSGNIDITYKVTEKEGVATIGAGMAYSAQDKWTGYLELSHPNLFGRGQRLYTKLELGGRLTNIQLGFVEPWLFNTRTSVGGDVYYTNRLWDYYTKRDIGTALYVSFPFYLDYTRFSYNFTLERTQVFDISETYTAPTSGYSLYDDTIPKWTLANTFGITRDSRDYIFNPSSGSYITVRAEVAKKFLFANVDYNRVTFEARTYFPIFWKFVLMNRVKAGIVTSVDEVPFYKRFYAGGIGDLGVRGYSDRSLSPMEEGRRVGGKVVFVNNIELKFKMSQSFALLAFYDAGNAFASYRDVTLHDIYRGIGVGIRLEVPMVGAIGFDLGYGLDKDRPGFTPHFQISPFGMF